MMVKSTKNLEQYFQEEMDKKYKRVPKRKWMFRLSTLLFVGFSLFMTMILSIVRDNAKTEILNQYLQATDSETLNTLYDNVGVRGNALALEWYEQNMLGIPNNIALAGNAWNCNVNRNNRNEIGQVVAFCDTKTGGLKVVVDGKRVYSGKDSVGEIIATNDTVYFINETDCDALYAYNIENNKVNKLINDSIHQFALYGNHIFYLNDAEKVVQYSIESRRIYDVADNIQRFYLSDGLIVQNGTNVMHVELDGSAYTPLVSNAFLVGADAQHAYYINFGISADVLQAEIIAGNSENQEDEENKKVIGENVMDKEIEGDYILFAINLSTKEKVAIDGRNNFIRAIYITEEGILVDTVK